MNKIIFWVLVTLLPMSALAQNQTVADSLPDHNWIEVYVGGSYSNINRPNGFGVDLGFRLYPIRGMGRVFYISGEIMNASPKGAAFNGGLMVDLAEMVRLSYTPKHKKVWGVLGVGFAGTYAPQNPIETLSSRIAWDAGMRGNITEKLSVYTLLHGGVGTWGVEEKLINGNSEPVELPGIFYQLKIGVSLRIL